MKLTSKIIYETNKDMNKSQIEKLKEDIQFFEGVEKGELQFFLVYLWNNYIEAVEFKDKYNCLCDRLEYEEGWDPRKED